LDKGEELVGLLSGASDWHTRAIDDVLTADFSGMIIWPTQPERVEALVLAYFPELGKESLALQQACITMNQVVIEMSKTKLPENFKDAHAALLSTASELQRGALKSMRSGGPGTRGG
jgi:hypothetical protein